MAEECEPLSASKYILAKYRIQVEDSVETDLVDFTKEFQDSGEHVHVGPRAIHPNLDGGKIGLNYESFCQAMCCLCVPIYVLNSFLISCCEVCYDDCSAYVTRKEEESTLKCCFNSCCQIN